MRIGDTNGGSAELGHMLVLSARKGAFIAEILQFCGRTRAESKETAEALSVLVFGNLPWVVGQSNPIHVGQAVSGSGVNFNPSG